MKTKKIGKQKDLKLNNPFETHIFVRKKIFQNAYQIGEAKLLYFEEYTKLQQSITKKKYICLR